MSDETGVEQLLRWRVGGVAITRVVESVTPVPAAYLLPEIVDADVATARPWIDPFFTDDATMLLSVHSFVVESSGTTIVVDTCAGMHSGRRLDGDPTFPDRLAAVVDGGLDGVDVVVCTHLHFDHVGWNTVPDGDGGWRPAFPNARYVIADDELDGFAERDEDGIAVAGIDPLAAADVLDRVDAGHRITDEVQLVATPGHTPGHVSVAIESNGATALITGDAVHSPIQLARPEITARRVDHDPAAAIATRRSLVDRLVDGDVLTLGTHFAAPTAGHVRRDDDGTVWFDTADRSATRA